NVAAIEVNRREYGVWRFDDREALDVKAADLLCLPGRRARPRLLRRIGGGSETGTFGDHEVRVLPSHDVADVGESLWRSAQRNRRDRGLIGLRVHDVCFRIVARA